MSRKPDRSLASWVKASTHRPRPRPATYQLDIRAFGGQHIGETRLERTQIDSVRLRLQFRKRESLGVIIEVIPVRPGPQHEVEQALRAPLVTDLLPRSLLTHVGT